MGIFLKLLILHSKDGENNVRLDHTKVQLLMIYLIFDFKYYTIIHFLNIHYSCCGCNKFICQLCGFQIYVHCNQGLMPDVKHLGVKFCKY